MHPELPVVAAPAYDPSLRVDVHSRDDVGSRVVAHGDIDGISAGQLHRTVIRVVREQRPGRIDVDVAGVGFLDCAGIRALLVCRGEAQQVGCSLTLVHPRPHVRRLLEITGLLEHFGLAEPDAMSPVIGGLPAA